MHRSGRPGGREGAGQPAARRPMSGSHEKQGGVQCKVASEGRKRNEGRNDAGAGHLPARERSVNPGGERGSRPRGGATFLMTEEGQQSAHRVSCRVGQLKRA